MKNALNRGEVEIVLDGEPLTLVPTLQCFQRLAAVSPYRKTLEALEQGDIAAVLIVLQHGLALDDKAVKALPEKLFKTGAIPLRHRLYDFVFMLFNAGKSQDEVLAEINKDADQGNAAGG